MIEGVTHAHLGPILYQSEPSDIPYSQTSHWSLTFFIIAYSKPALKMALSLKRLEDFWLTGFLHLQNRYSKSLSWAKNSNFPPKSVNTVLKFSPQDSDLEFWRSKKSPVSSDSKPPLAGLNQTYWQELPFLKFKTENSLFPGTPLIHHPSHNLQQLRWQAWHQLKLNQRQPMQLPLLPTILDSEKPITTYLIVSVRLWNFFFGGSKIN